MREIVQFQKLKKNAAVPKKYIIYFVSIIQLSNKSKQNGNKYYGEVRSKTTEKQKQDSSFAEEQKKLLS